MEDKNRTKLDIEFYLLNREYADLSVDELKIVSEHIGSEQEFNEMKAALLGVGNFFKQEEELEPNPAIKTALLREFNKQQPRGSYWLNGLFVSLFPKEKKLFQKPGMQLIGLAASVLLIVTLTFNLNEGVNSTELAQNDKAMSEQKIIDEIGVVEKVKATESEQKESTSAENKDVSIKTSNENDVRKQLSEETILGENNDNRIAGGTGYIDEIILPAPTEELNNTEIEQEMMTRNKNEVASAKDFSNLKKLNNAKTPKAADKLVIYGETSPTSGMVETISLSDSSMDMEDAEIDLPINSRTLSEDADLIGILYTAL